MIPGTWLWVAWPPLAAVLVWIEIRRGRGRWHVLGVVALATYALWIASVAFFPMPVEGPALPGDGGVGPVMMNLVPIRDLVNSFGRLGVGQIVRQHGGNFLLLVPFTLLGPVLWRGLRSWKRALALGVGLSVAIEALQLVFCALIGSPYRSVDIDDVIVNTAGAMLGYGLFAAGRWAVTRRRGVTRRRDRPATH